MRTPTLLTLPVALVLGACGGDAAPNPVREAFAQAGGEGIAPTPVLFRFAADRVADARVYQLPSLEERDGMVRTGRRPLAHIVGFSSDAGVVYALDTDGRLIALDAAADRTRVADSTIALATVGPTGTTFAVHDDGAVGIVQSRSTTHLPSGFSARPERIWGALRERLIGVVGSGEQRRLEMVQEGQSRVAQPLPDGAIAVAPWGDAAAVATDAGVMVLDPADPEARRSAPVREARLVEYSPSGHRLYVVDAEATLRVLERFELAEIDRLALPGPAGALRRDARGDRLLIRAADGERFWIVDLPRLEVAAEVAGAWDDELPRASMDGSVLLRRGGRFVVLSRTDLEPTDSVADPRADHWLVAAWDPRQPAPELVREEAPEAAPAGKLLYLQVSSTSNEAWAVDLARNLQQAGIAASVLPPTEEEKRFRVVVGPYATREEAENMRRRLSLPSWIFALDTATTIP